MTEEIGIEVEGKHISGHYVGKDGMVTPSAYPACPWGPVTGTEIGKGLCQGAIA